MGCSPPRFVRVLLAMPKVAGRCLPPIAAVALCLASSPALAFHSGGVGECDGCHSIHSSVDGMAPGRPTGGYLLKGSDPGSVCLNCHQAQGDIGPVSYHASTAEADMPPGLPPRQRSPGGDFGWLKKFFLWPGRPGDPSETSPGERHGHSIVALDYGFASDLRSSVAPGGNYPSASLSCISCHDPHGQYRRLADGSISTSGLPIVGSGSHADDPEPRAGVAAVGAYRMLGGAGYLPKSLGSGALAFSNPPPAAVAPRAYNRTEKTTQTRVAYGRDMSEWCANCHPGILVSGYTERMAGLRHPAGNGAILGGTMARNYAAYVRTGRLTGDATRSFLSLVPFEEGHSDYQRLRDHARSDDTYLQGPEEVSQVTCLTCHRAHASGFDGALRFKAKGEFITVGDSTTGARWPDPLLDSAIAEGRTVAETQASYYDRPASVFSPFQRTLCNKCHVKD